MRVEAVRSKPNVVVYSEGGLPSSRQGHSKLVAAMIAPDDDLEMMDFQQIHVGPLDWWSLHMAENNWHILHPRLNLNTACTSGIKQ